VVVSQDEPVTPRRSLALAVVIAVIAVATAFFATSKTHSSADVDKLLGTAGAEGAALVKPAPGYGPLPSLAPATAWDNSPPLTDASLKGKVVLVDFWDASCINCRRTFDFLRRLQATYSSQGLVILGIHSPEFAFEKSHSYVAEQVRELHVTWPVAEDPQMAIWNEFGNEYWPANYLTDRNGNIRYYHFGEGDEEQIEGAVRALLAEGGSAGSKVVGTVPESQQPPSQNENVTPETYIGTGHGDLTSVVKLSAGVVRTAEYATLQTSQSLTLTFNAKDVYVVLDPGGTTPRTLSVTLDGRPLTDARRGPDVSPDGVLTVGHEDLFHVVTGGEVSAGTLVLTSTGGPVQVYSFTFGG
jgi:thiol-disulfide isomerase/thioredoxin